MSDNRCGGEVAGACRGANGANSEHRIGRAGMVIFWPVSAHLPCARARWWQWMHRTRRLIVCFHW